MTNEKREREQTLWSLTEIEDPAAGDGLDPGAAPVTDELLAALGRGTLDPPERRRVEKLLVRDAEARRRLLAMVDRSAVEAPSDVRQALLERFSRPGRQVSPESSRQPYRWMALAAVLLTALAAGLFLRPTALPPSYDVSIEGLQSQRQDDRAQDNPGRESEAVAFPDTRITVKAVVREAADQSVDVALYREVGDTLERIPEGAGVVREAWQGVVLLHASAEALVGTVPGVYPLFLVIGKRTNLLAVLERPASLDQGAPEAVDNDRRLYRLTLHLRIPTSFTPDAGRTLREEALNEMAERLLGDHALPDPGRRGRVHSERRGAFPL